MDCFYSQSNREANMLPGWIEVSGLNQIQSSDEPLVIP